MRIQGKRIKRTRLIQKGKYVVAVDAHAAKGDTAWLRRVGKVYELVS